MDLGRFEISKGPSNRGWGWTLDFLRSPTGPLGGGGGWTLDFSKSQIDGLVQTESAPRRGLLPRSSSAAAALKLCVRAQAQGASVL